MCSEQAELQSQRFLLVVIGPPGAGKTRFSREFVERVNYSCQEASKDDVQKRYCGPPVNETDYLEKFREPIYKQLDREIDYLLSYGSVVVDVTHRLERTKKGWENGYREIAEMHNVPVFFIELYPPAEILRPRLNQRPKPPSFYDDIATETGWLRFEKDWLSEPTQLPLDCSLRVDNSGHPSETVDIVLAFTRERSGSLSQARFVLNYT